VSKVRLFSNGAQLALLGVNTVNSTIQKYLLEVGRRSTQFLYLGALYVPYVNMHTGHEGVLTDILPVENAAE
jgi:hypothetical protein